jgi:hypothetical protein
LQSALQGLKITAIHFEQFGRGTKKRRPRLMVWAWIAVSSFIAHATRRIIGAQID